MAVIFGLFLQEAVAIGPTEWTTTIVLLFTAATASIYFMIRKRRDQSLEGK